MKTFRTGDLVVYSKGYDNGVSILWWCKVLDLIVKGESYNTYDVITGRGDKNTKVTFRLKPIGVSYHSMWEMDRKIEPLNESDFLTDKTHDVHLVETDYMEKRYDELIQKANDKINFIRQHRNRIEKLEELI